MGRKGKGRKYDAPPAGGSSSSAASVAPNWNSAGQGQRLGGSDVVPRAPIREAAAARPYPAAPARAAATAVNASTSAGRSDAPAGLQRVREGGDGNCFFHAIARQQLGDPGLHDQARTEICDWMQAYLLPSAIAAGRSRVSEAHQRLVQEQRAEVFKPVRRDGDALVLRYAKKMRRTGEWGTGLEALCVAYLYKRPVHIWGRTGASVLQPLAELMAPDAIPLRLLHNGRNHWDSALPLEDASRNIIPIPDDSTLALEEVQLEAALTASLQEFQGDSFLLGGAEPAGNATNFQDGQDTRALQRALAASAAATRLEREDSKGLGGAGRAAELRHAREKSTLLGQLQERCARRGEEMPIGAGLATVDKLRTLVDARAPRVTIDGLELGPSTRETQAGSSSASSVPASATAEMPVAAASGRWNRRLRQNATTEASAAAPEATEPMEDTTTWQTVGAEVIDVDALGYFEGDGDVEMLDALDASMCRGSSDPAPVLHLRLVEHGAQLEDCVKALCQKGFTIDEAADIVALCDGDVARVRELYDIQTC